MTDVKSKYLSEVRENGSADGSFKVRGISVREYVVAPTADAFLRLRSLVSAVGGDESMD